MSQQDSLIDLQSSQSQSSQSQSSQKELAQIKSYLAKLESSQTPSSSVSQTSSLVKKTCEQRSKVDLRPYQKRVMKYLNVNDRLLVYHKMGTGKTLTAVLCSQCFLDENPTKKVIVVSPASLIDNFKKGMSEYGNLRHKNKYEFYSIQMCTKAIRNGTLKCTGNMVIIDEAHNYKTDIKMKDDKIKAGKNVFEGYKCFLNADKLLLLTGTPVYNRPDDLTVYKVLLNYYPKSPTIDYPQEYIRSTGYTRYLLKKKINGIMDAVYLYKYQNIDILKCKVSYHNFQNDSDFPTRIDKLEQINMRPDYEKQYFKILNEVDGEQKKLIPKVFKNYTPKNENQFLNLTRRATQNIDNNVKLNAKIAFVQNLINRYKKTNEKLPDKDKYKVVVYSQFIDHGIQLIKNIIDVPSVTISGQTKVAERAAICDKYNKGLITVIFLTKAGGEGLDLKGTDSIILMEPTWNDNQSEQVIARAIRYKSHENRPENRRKVYVYRLAHVSHDDRSKETTEYIKSYLAELRQQLQKNKNIFPSVMELAANISSCDLVMETFQKAKQIVLNYYDEQLQDLSIEKLPSKKYPETNCMSIKVVAYPDGSLTKENGKMINQMEKEKWFSEMEMSMKACGKTENQTDKVH